jgi:hypothetical protein
MWCGVEGTLWWRRWLDHTGESQGKLGHAGMLGHEGARRQQVGPMARCCTDIPTWGVGHRAGVRPHGRRAASDGRHLPFVIKEDTRCGIRWTSGPNGMGGPRLAPQGRWTVCLPHRSGPSAPLGCRGSRRGNPDPSVANATVSPATRVSGGDRVVLRSTIATAAHGCVGNVTRVQHIVSVGSTTPRRPCLNS